MRRLRRLYEEKKKPGIGRYPMGPTIIVINLLSCQNILFPKKKKSLQVLSKQGKMVWGLFLYPTTKSVETYF